MDLVPDLIGMLGPGGSEEVELVEALGRIGGREMAWSLLDHLGRRDLRTRTKREIEIVLGDVGDPRLSAFVGASRSSVHPPAPPAD